MMKCTTILGRLLLCTALAGCVETGKPTSRPLTTRERQDQAIKDPFGYSPGVQQDISGGGIGEFDRDAFQKDLKNVLDP